MISNRYGWLRWLFLALPMLAVSAADQRPNLLFILSGDHGADVTGYAGHPLVQTPSLDWLAQEGVAFRNAFATTLICAIWKRIPRERVAFAKNPAYEPELFRLWALADRRPRELGPDC